jgi:hypothetical protein
MNLTQIVFRKAVLLLLSTTVFLPSVSAQADAAAGKAVVRAVKGTAAFSSDGSIFQPLKTGAVLPSGSTVKTAPASTVDLFLGNSAGVVRVAENSTLALDKLAITDTGADTVVDVQMNLPEGTMFFNVNKLSAASKYEIKVPNGVAGIRGTRGRANSNSYIVLLDGTLIFVHVPPGGQPVPYTLVAPPPVYFSPLEGIKPAPQDLILDTDSGFQGTTPEPPVEAGGGVQEEPVIFVEPDKGETPVSPTMPVDQ